MLPLCKYIGRVLRRERKLRDLGRAMGLSRRGMVEVMKLFAVVLSIGIVAALSSFAVWLWFAVQQEENP